MLLGRAVVVPQNRLGGLGRAVHGEVSVIHLPLQIVQRPACVEATSLMAGVGTDGRIAVVHGRPPPDCRCADEPAAAAHHELAVPGVGQQQREANLRADDAGDAAMSRANCSAGCGGHGDRLADLDVGQRQAVSPAQSRWGAGVCADKTIDNTPPQRIAASHRFVIFMAPPFEVEDSAMIDDGGTSDVESGG